MNEQQRLYLVQARSDWQVYNYLKGQHPCHRLHYLQMCTEKIGKAFFWRGQKQGAENLGHAAFVKLVRAIATNRRVADEMGYKNNLAAFGEWIKDVSDLVYSLERLAPALAADGPNPEYPWPRENPQKAPVEEKFSAWDDLQTRNGRHLTRLLDIVLGHFDQWF